MTILTYSFFQLVILLATLYQIRLLDTIQKDRAELNDKYHPTLEVIRSEIEALEIKIRKGVKIVDSVN
jgi:hypothetical protein